ncbi:MAG TPA: aminoglycoside phosphotransferase family protein [Bryobacteraceae bacterium]|nr:aminoglycoside phosphotransferase family protein [Bryobacteraceae bacterium]
MNSEPVIIPERLASACQNSADREAWLVVLPSVVRELETRWSLHAGEPFDGEDVSCSWVAPVTLADRSSAVLKVAMPHMEGEHEIQGLRFWNANPTVRLLDYDSHLGAMLLERCQPGTALRTLPQSEQDVVLAALLRRLWRMPSSPYPFRHLRLMTAHWSQHTIAAANRWRDGGLVKEGLKLFETLTEPTPDDVLLATDLHAGNVLRAQREEWLVIDPKPFTGDPAYDATQHLFNCEERLLCAPDATIGRIADLLGLEHERIRLWIFARAAAEPRDDWRQDWRLQLARAIAPA